MEFKEILRFADDAVFAKTGKHLNDLQRDVLEETLQGNKYAKIAAEHECTIDHVRTVAADLWKYLSEELGEKVKRSNVRATFQRAGFTIIQSNLHHNIITSCGNGLDPPDVSKQKNPDIQTPYIDLDDAPSPTLFYGRTEELNTLEHWIIKQKSRIIAICGLLGIGKTSLTLQLVENIKHQFDYVIWRNLKYFPEAEELQQELVDIFIKTENQETGAKAQLRTLIQYLRKYRCLIIVDDLQSLFVNGELSGKYHNESKSYQNLFKSIAETNHQSCVVLLSQEKPKEILQLEEINPAVRTLELKGLDDSARGILKFQGLQDEAMWLNLIELYQGNPQWLQSIAKTIQELSKGKINDVFIDDAILLTEELQDCLEQIYQRLADEEKTILIVIAQQNKAVNLPQLRKLVNLPQMELINGVRSLSRRCLLEVVENPEISYTVNLVIREFAIANSYN